MRYLLQVFFVSSSSPDQDQKINKKYDKNKKEDCNISSFKHWTKTIHYSAEVDRVWRHIHHWTKCSQMCTTAVSLSNACQITNLYLDKDIKILYFEEG